MIAVDSKTYDILKNKKLTKYFSSVYFLHLKIEKSLFGSLLLLNAFD
jgi:hypothetical protein